MTQTIISELNPRIESIQNSLDGIRKSDDNKTKIMEEIVAKSALSKINNIEEWKLFKKRSRQDIKEL